MDTSINGIIEHGIRKGFKNEEDDEVYVTMLKEEFKER